MSKGVTFEARKLNNFVKALTNKSVVQVGIFGKANGRRSSEKTNAEIGAQHEFGTEKIPRRSFLRMPIFQMSDEIIKRTGEGALDLLVKNEPVALLKQLGFACEIVIDKAFRTRGFGSWKENAPLTIAMKGSSDPLIDTGQLKRSIDSRVVNATS